VALFVFRMRTDTGKMILNNGQDLFGRVDYLEQKQIIGINTA
jgi:hypothetical protein